ncbi:MAG: VOC family protein [Pseudomonadota bacterium]
MDLNQVTVAVRDFHESVAFYSKLGLRLIVSERDEYARFEMPSGSSTFSVYVSDAPVAGDTVIYFEVDDVDRTYTELCARGIPFDTTPKDESFRWRTAYFSDPSGNPFCLFHAGPERRFPPWRLED